MVPLRAGPKVGEEVVRQRRLAPGQDQDGAGQGEETVAQCPAERRPIQPHQRSHDGVGLLPSDLTADEERAQHGHEGDRKQR